MSKPSVLFVCLGNICRSPMAEGAFRSAAEKAALDVETDSAGTADYHVGQPPDARAIRTAADNGVEIPGLRGRQLRPDDFARFTHIFAMDRQNLRNIESIRSDDSGAKVALLMDTVRGREGEEVADPYHDGDEQFALTWADVDAAAKSIVAALKSEKA
ncbi:low molecular weight protein-tyrosine-phosphatase [Qipengyuania sp. JC766]|uniref:low molecular weight protein-tyrosine-phosphatase n=1 Tax=Qipengyuania sp. JC766 TaxID=3232139 RepID=UPI003458E816